MDEKTLKEILGLEVGTIVEMTIKGYRKPVIIERMKNGFTLTMAQDGGYAVITRYDENGISRKQWCEKVK